MSTNLSSIEPVRVVEMSRHNESGIPFPIRSTTNKGEIKEENLSQSKSNGISDESFLQLDKKIPGIHCDSPTGSLAGVGRNQFYKHTDLGALKGLNSDLFSNNARKNLSKTTTVAEGKNNRYNRIRFSMNPTTKSRSRRK